MNDSQTGPATGTPFDLADTEGYRRWRDQKLAHHPRALADLVVEIGDPRRLSAVEHQALLASCRRANMAIYAGRTGDDPEKEIIRRLGLQFGLRRLDHNPGADEDAISALTVQSDAYHKGYIPYTNRPIAWHTDGYYNGPARQIHGLLLHCVHPAAVGGENELLDHEIVYLLLRDENPDYIRALMHPRAMVIPPNVSQGKEIRPEQPGPVFSVGPNGRLHMRYTDRSRSIVWRDDPTTGAAVARLKTILHQPGPWHFRARLEPGQGLLSNNVLHTRSGFDDGAEPRLLYRARYYDRIQGT
jgi:hypothetical protein